MSAVLANLEIFWEGFEATLALTLLSTIAALVLGILLAAFRVSPVPVLSGAAATYVEVVRNTPLTIVFFFAAFVLPQVGVKFSYFAFAVLAMSVYYASFFCEVIRSGINTMPIGQLEAARSIGLTFTKSMRLIVMPQALRTVVPPLINVFIQLTKSTSIASAFGVVELLSVMARLANQESQAVIAILIATAVFYLVITIPSGIIAGHIERRVAIAR